MDSVLADIDLHFFNCVGVKYSTTIQKNAKLLHFLLLSHFTFVMRIH